MKLITEVQKPFLDQFCITYFDNILIYSTSLDDHLQHLTKIFGVLRHHKLYFNMPKCEFVIKSVHFLGFVISKEGIQIDSHKVTTVLNWPTPKSITKIKSFHDLVNFYRCFICGFV